MSIIISVRTTYNILFIGVIYMEKLNSILAELNSVRTAKKSLASREKELLKEIEEYLPEGYSPISIETDDYILKRFPALSGERFNVAEVRKLAIRNHIKLVDRVVKHKVIESALADIVGSIISEEEYDSLKILCNKLKIDVK